MSQHAELIARLEAAEAGSRELDLAVVRAIGEDGDLVGWPPYTTSLDTALAWVERLGMDGFHTMYAALMNWKAHDPRGPLSQSLPLALCIAILRAKQGEG